jgi:hypothetical protein
MRTQIAALVGVLVALMACKEGGDSSKPASNKQPEVTVTAKELQSEYKANEARADARFKGKVIKVSGRVESIDSDLMDDPVVHLASGELLGVSLHGLPKDVAISLNKGDSVTFICVGGGEVVGSPRLDDCRKP